MEPRGLDALIGRLGALGERWLLQEWVPGGDDAMYSHHSFHGPSSEPVASSVVRKIRQWPPRAGSTTLAVHVAAPEIETTSNDVLSRAGWRGLCLPSPASRGVPRLGTRWIWWRADRAAAAHYRRAGELSLAGYLRSLGGHPIEAEISCSDPLPFLVAAIRGLRRRLGAGTPATRASPSRSTAPG